MAKKAKLSDIARIVESIPIKEYDINADKYGCFVEIKKLKEFDKLIRKYNMEYYQKPHSEEQARLSAMHKNCFFIYREPINSIKNNKERTSRNKIISKLERDGFRCIP